jgi:hypothetical protein
MIRFVFFFFLTLLYSTLPYSTLANVFVLFCVVSCSLLTLPVSDRYLHLQISPCVFHLYVYYFIAITVRTQQR